MKGRTTLESKQKKLIKNSALLLAGNLLSKMMVFLLVPFYTSILSTSEYAIADLITTTVNLVCPIASISIASSVLRFCLDGTHAKRDIYSISFWIDILGLGLTSAVLILIVPITKLADYKYYLIAYLICYTINYLLLQYAKGCEKVVIYASAGCINTFALIICNLWFFLVIKIGINGYLYSMIISQGLSAIYIMLACKATPRGIKVFEEQKYLVRDMIKYSVPLIPGAFSWWLNASADRYIMTWFRPIGELGLYSVASKIPGIQFMFMNALMGAWEISAVEKFGTEENRQFFSEMFNKYVNFLILICCSICIISKPAAYFLYQNDFFEAWRIVPFLSVASVFEILSLFVGTIYTAAKRTKMIFVTTTIGALSNVILNILLIPRFGGFGAAAATATSFFVVYEVRFAFSRSILKLDADIIKQHILLGLMVLLAVLSRMDSSLMYVVIVIVFFALRKSVVDILKFVMRYTRSIVQRIRGN